MIKDCRGNEVKEGDRVFLRSIDGVWFDGIIKELRQGGVIQPISKTQGIMTGDVLVLEVQVGFPEPPGQNKTFMHRLINPDKERLVKIGD